MSQGEKVGGSVFRFPFSVFRFPFSVIRYPFSPFRFSFNSHLLCLNLRSWVFFL